MKNILSRILAHPLGIASVLAPFLLIFTAGHLQAQAPSQVIYNWTTLAGSTGGSGFADGTGASARFNTPCGLAMDAAGNFYVSDENSNVIREISPAGQVTTLAGNAQSYGYLNGTGTNAEFYDPRSVAVDGAGTVYVADLQNNVIRKITPDGVVTTLAGNSMSGYVDGTGTNAEFSAPTGVAVDGTGNVYVTEYNNGAIRMITPGGAVTTIAGSKQGGYVDASGTNARFSAPSGVVVDGEGNIYVADTNNNAIRMITPTGIVTTLAGGRYGYLNATGSNAKFARPVGLALDSGTNLYVADTDNNAIRMITPAGVVTTVADRNDADFTYPTGIVLDGSGNVFVTDNRNSAIREIAAGPVVSTFAGQVNQQGYLDATGSAALFTEPEGVTVDGSGNVYVADTGNNVIRMITPGGVVSTLAGNEQESGYLEGTGTNAEFDSPAGLAVDGSNNVYVADLQNNVIRMITPAGVVSTYAGQGYGHADGPSSTASFLQPSGLAFDSGGNLYVADSSNNEIRMITPAGVVSTLAGSAAFDDRGQPMGGYVDATGTNARFNDPYAVAVDSGSNVYVADSRNSAIRKVTPAGVVTTFAAGVDSVGPIAVDGAGNVYVDGYSDILMITPNGTRTVIGGNPNFGPGNQDGLEENALFYAPDGLALDGSGNFYVADYGNNRIVTGVVANVLRTVSITSNNAHSSSYAKGGDTITLAFTSNKTIQTPQVTMLGNSVSVSSTGGNVWVATITVTDSSSQGIVPFTIDFTDLQGNQGTTVTTTSDASSVFIDTSTPSIDVSNVPTTGYYAGGELADLTGLVVTGSDPGEVTVTQDPLPGTTLATGSLMVTFTAMNGAGTSVDAPVTLTVDPFQVVSTGGGSVPGSSGASTYVLTGIPTVASFLGEEHTGSKKTSSIFGADGSVLLQVGGDVAGLKISKLADNPSGDAALVTLANSGSAVTGATDVALVTGLDSDTPQIVARTGVTNPNLPAHVTIKEFLVIDGNGEDTFFLASLQGTGITGANNMALCVAGTDGSIHLIAQKNETVTLSGSSRKISTITTMADSAGTAADDRWRAGDTSYGFRATFTDKSEGIFVAPATSTTATGGTDWGFVCKTGTIGTISTLNGTVASNFGLPGFSEDTVATLVNLTVNSKQGVSNHNNVALVGGIYGQPLEVLARTGSSAPDVTGTAPLPGITFNSLLDPVSGAGGAIAFEGTLAGPGVSNSNKTGIWFAPAGMTPALVARTGTSSAAAAPGGGHWSKFDMMVLPDDPSHGPVFIATLTNSNVEGVNGTNNVGLWALRSDGTLGLLIRTGQSVGGKTVKSFSALVPAVQSVGAGGGYDDAGDIAALVTLSDGTESLVLLTAP